jgi:hypothetical protein
MSPRTHTAAGGNRRVFCAIDAAIPEQIAAIRKVRLDRIVRRTKDGMTCWLCENAPELALGIAPNARNLGNHPSINSIGHHRK